MFNLESSGVQASDWALWAEMSDDELAAIAQGITGPGSQPAPIEAQRVVLDQGEEPEMEGMAEGLFPPHSMVKSLIS